MDTIAPLILGVSIGLLYTFLVDPQVMVFEAYPAAQANGVRMGWGPRFKYFQKCMSVDDALAAMWRGEHVNVRGEWNAKRLRARWIASGGLP